LNQYVVIIGILALVLTSLTLIKSSIDDQQEIQEINNVMAQKKITQMSEASGVSGIINADNSNGLIIQNLMNEHVKVDQIRVYEDDGDFVKSFSINQTISGNSKQFLNVTSELQAMMQG